MDTAQLTRLKKLEEELLAQQRMATALATRIYEMHEEVVDLLLSELAKPLSA
jgi:hypothetical protein